MLFVERCVLTAAVWVFVLLRWCHVELLNDVDLFGVVFIIHGSERLPAATHLTGTNVNDLWLLWCLWANSAFKWSLLMTFDLQFKSRSLLLLILHDLMGFMLLHLTSRSLGLVNNSTQASSVLCSITYFLWIDAGKLWKHDFGAEHRLRNDSFVFLTCIILHCFTHQIEYSIFISRISHGLCHIRLLMTLSQLIL